MGKNKGYKSMMAIIGCVFFLIAMSVAVFLGGRKTLNYKMNGTPVEARVTQVFKVGKTELVESVYMSEFGFEITADTIFNGSPEVGDVFTGYVLPDEPGEVYRMPPSWLIALFCGVLGLLYILCIVIIILSARTHRHNRLLSVNGIPAKASIMQVTRVKTFVFNCLVSFTAYNGIEYTATVQFTRSVPNADGECSIIYYLTPKGKLIVDLIEL